MALFGRHGRRRLILQCIRFKKDGNRNIWSSGSFTIRLFYTFNFVSNNTELGFLLLFGRAFSNNMLQHASKERLDVGNSIKFVQYRLCRMIDG